MKTFKEYEELVRITSNHPALKHDHKAVALFGLAGEVGELLGEYKKHLRDNDAYSGFEARVGEELGDLLWYVTAIGRAFNISLQDIVERNVVKVNRSVGSRRDGCPSRVAAFPKVRRRALSALPSSARHYS